MDHLYQHKKGVFPMRTLLYDLLKRGVSLCFNILNVLLGGNLPPFGSAAVLVEEQDRYLVVELPQHEYGELRLCR